MTSRSARNDGRLRSGPVRPVGMWQLPRAASMWWWVFLHAPIGGCDAFWGIAKDETGILDSEGSGSDSGADGDSECDDPVRYECYYGDIHWTSCGDEGWEDCPEGRCEEESPDEARCCSDFNRLACEGSELVAYDDCGNVGWRTSCEEACYQDACVQSRCDFYVDFDPATCDEVLLLWLHGGGAMAYNEGKPYRVGQLSVDVGERGSIECSSELLESGAQRECSVEYLEYTCVGSDFYYAYHCNG